LGERLYVRDYTGPMIQAPRVMLHAAELGFKHPGSGAEMMWKRDVPADFGLLVEQLRVESR
jgi:23S rRNA pseudouridine1911/1915/1917 synthase